MKRALTFLRGDAKPIEFVLVVLCLLVIIAIPTGVLS